MYFYQSFFSEMLKFKKKYRTFFEFAQTFKIHIMGIKLSESLYAFKFFSVFCCKILIFCQSTIVFFFVKILKNFPINDIGDKQSKILNVFSILSNVFQNNSNLTNYQLH